MKVDPTSRGSVIFALLLLMVGYGLTKENQLIMDADDAKPSNKHVLEQQTVEQQIAKQFAKDDDDKIERIQIELLSTDSFSKEDTLDALKQAEKMIAVTKQHNKALLENNAKFNKFKWNEQQFQILAKQLDTTDLINRALALNNFECDVATCRFTLNTEQPLDNEALTKVKHQLESIFLKQGSAFAEGYEILLDEVNSTDSSLMFVLRPIVQ